MIDGVVLNIGGNSEAFEDGINGILVPPRNPADLAEALTFWLGNRGKASLGSTLSSYLRPFSKERQFM